MAISLTCPSCNTRLKAPDSAVGRSVKCPKCRRSLPVQEEIVAVIDEPAATVDAPAPKKKGGSRTCLVLSLLGLLGVGGCCILWFTPGLVLLVRELTADKEQVARTDIHDIDSALRTWHIEDGRPDHEYPTSLAELTVVTEPGHYRMWYLEPRRLADPWGHPYRYEPFTRSPDGMPLVYSDGPPGGKKIRNWEERSAPAPGTPWESAKQ